MAKTAYEKIYFIASERREAKEACATLVKIYGQSDPKHCDVIVALGGDGFMLQTLHDYMELKKPIYGMNFGSVGFLMNEYSEHHLLNRLDEAKVARIHPLKMTARTTAGQEAVALAINEVSLLRETRQTAKLRITIDGKMRMAELICDGVMVATPAGSTAYNLSAYGPIIPINANLLALTPLSAFRPRRWRGALLPHDAKVRFDVLESDFRRVSAVADNTEIRDVVQVDVEEMRSVDLLMLFDRDHSLEERILIEQFSN